MNFNCPLPISDYKRILLAHGGGGKLSRDLLEKVSYARLSNPHLLRNHDGAILDLPKGKLAFTTDYYVVHPLFFPAETSGVWLFTEPSTTSPCAGPGRATSV